MSVAGYGERDFARWIDEAPKATTADRRPFERDRARVLHSAALRRLAAKTQVVGIGLSDFPRTRLTHSLECAQIGRELAAAVGADPDLVETGCLAHDLGHPPFGHNGEAALAGIAETCGGFEGNAQSLRVLTRLEAKVLGPDGTSAGLNLTRAALDAATKYPWRRSTNVSAPADVRTLSGADRSRKFGVYDDDVAVFEWLRADSPGDRRCVEAQVMDWSDDVAYSVHDLEDGIHAGHVDPLVVRDRQERGAVVALAAESYSDASVDDLTAAAERLAALDVWPVGFDGTTRALVALKRMTSELIARLSVAAIDATRASNGGASLSRYGGDLVVPAGARAECAVLKAVADRYVMRRSEAKRMQARQREQVAELAAALAATAPESLEPWLRDAYGRASDDAARLRVVVDQVASLTDVSAIAWWERWAR